MSRTLAQGIAEGRGMRDLSRTLAERVDVGTTRARVLVRTEVIGAHAEATLNSYTEAGLEGAEVTTAIMPGVTWAFLGTLLLVLGKVSKRGLRHPPTDDQRLSPKHRLVGYVCILIFVVTFMPILMRPVIM